MPPVFCVAAIHEQYQSFALFQQQFQTSAAAVFGSGWLWLAVDGDDTLQICHTANQDVLVRLSFISSDQDRVFFLIFI